MFERLYLESLIHGNMSSSTAQSLQSTIESILSPRVLTSSEKRLGERTLLLPPPAVPTPQGSQHVWQVDIANPSEPNSAIEYYVECGDIEDDKARPRVSLLASIISEPSFNVLRTKEQLGYIVFALARGSTGAMGMRIIVQSEKSPVFLETRIEAFLDYFKEFLEAMSEEEFEKHKQAVIQKKLEKPKNLHGESSRYWTAIEDGYYDFQRRYRDAEETGTITKQEVIDLYLAKIHPGSQTGQRKKLSVHMLSLIHI